MVSKKRIEKSKHEKELARANGNWEIECAPRLVFPSKNEHDGESQPDKITIQEFERGRIISILNGNTDSCFLSY